MEPSRRKTPGFGKHRLPLGLPPRDGCLQRRRCCAWRIRCSCRYCLHLLEWAQTRVAKAGQVSRLEDRTSYWHSGQTDSVEVLQRRHPFRCLRRKACRTRAVLVVVAWLRRTCVIRSGIVSDGSGFRRGWWHSWSASWLRWAGE